MNLLDPAQYEVLYVMFNENAIFDTLEEAKAYALEYGGKVFVCRGSSGGVSGWTMGLGRSE